MRILSIIFCLLLINKKYTNGEDNEDDEDPFKTTDPKKREPSPCEICKFFVTELKSRLDESARSKEIIRTGQGLDKKKSFKYLTSELRLTEALHEPHICEKILDYNVHAERKGSNRYAKGMSETMQTLHGLVNKGVKVELGIPYELWDKPSAEVSRMHRACFTFAEKYEENIEDWYFNKQGEVDLLKYLCEERYLIDKNQDCLQEYNKHSINGDNQDQSTSYQNAEQLHKATTSSPHMIPDSLEIPKPPLSQTTPMNNHDEF